jgi:hypothetical protein
MNLFPVVKDFAVDRDRDIPSTTARWFFYILKIALPYNKDMNHERINCT